MKHLILLFISFLFCLPMATIGQAPGGINYQAVARDAQGKPITDQALAFQISLQQNEGRPFVFYREIHKVTSNAQGLVNFAIGRGELVSGSFADVPWSEGNIWVEIGIDRTLTGDFEVLGSSELLSVPYALHAESASKLIGDQTLDQTGDGSAPGSNAKQLPCENNACPCSIGVTRIKMIYNGGPIDKIEWFRNNTNGSVRQTFNNIVDGQVLEIAAQTPFAQLPGTIKVLVQPDVNDSDADFVICIGGSCHNDIVGKSFGPFSITEREDRLNNVCSIDEGNTGWTVRGNVLESPVNKFGSLNDQDVIFMSTNRDRGVMTKDGDFGFGTTNPGAKVHVFGGQQIIENTVSIADPMNDSAYGLVVNSPRQGMIIRLTEKEGRLADLNNSMVGNQPDTSNHFITFMGANNQPLGRIEGEKGSDARSGNFINDDDWKLELLERDDAETFLTENIIFNTGELALATADVASLALDLITELALEVAAAACAATGFDACIGAAIVATSTADIVSLGVKTISYGANVLNETATLAASVLELTITSDNNNQAEDNRFKYRGVVYASGGADYAEYLQRANLDEVLHAGDIVGVNTGRISKFTNQSFEFRVITTNPVVLGNMPDPGKEDQYNRVGFLGQVPVKVRGTVKAGDYILPSGNNDGIGIAKSAGEMEIEDFQKIVGRAWSSHSGTGVGKVNLAIGLNSNDIAVVTRKQQNELDYLFAEFEKVKTTLEAIQSGSTESVSATSNIAESTPNPEFNPYAIKKVFNILNAVYQADPTFLTKQGYGSSILELIASEEKTNSYISSLVDLVEQYGYTIVSESDAKVRSGSNYINPAFLNYDAQEMYRTLSEIKVNEDTDAALVDVVNNPSKQDEVVNTIKIAQAIAKVLMQE